MLRSPTIYIAIRISIFSSHVVGSDTQRIIVILILVIVLIELERPLEVVHCQVLVERHAGEVVLVRHRRENIARLPVADPGKLRVEIVELGEQKVNACLSDGDVLGFGAGCSWFLEADLARGWEDLNESVHARANQMGHSNLGRS
jgi:hypothetical protein